MAATRLPASWMNALDPAAGARPSRLTAARAGAPRCPYISRRSRPASEPTVTVPSSFGRGELRRCLRAPFARNVIPGAHAALYALERAKMISRRALIAGADSRLSVSSVAYGQQPRRMPRIGVLWHAANIEEESPY